MSRSKPRIRQHSRPGPSRLLSGLLAQHAGWQMVEIGRDDAPLDATGRARHISMMRSALAELRCGSQPTEDAWRLLADACNYVETLGALGYADKQEISASLQPAVHGLARAAERNQADGLPLRLDGPTLQALQWALDAWEQALSELSEQASRHVTLVTQRRAYLIQTGQITPRDAVLIGFSNRSLTPTP